MDEDRVAELLAQRGVEERVRTPLAQFAGLLLDANRRFNLTGAGTADELVSHIVDSLSIASYVQAPLVDVGSGGGLPAIPLAIATGTVVTMVEATTKKAAFLQSVLRLLGIEGRVIPDRAEIAARHDDLRERFGSATARAVSAAPTVLELTVPFLRVGGIAVLQRGRVEERERNAVLDAAPMLGALLEQEIPLQGERRLLIVRKISPTPQRFPRRTGVPEKRPLCL